MKTQAQKLAKLVLVSAGLSVALWPVAPARAGNVLATGQTTAYQADKNDGIAGPVDVPDDGALQLGATLRYRLLQNGTVRDEKTGLIWEVKCSGCGGLHDVANTYPWSGDGSIDTIWDWLDQVNAEGYAGHNDWRIPNVKELHSIADYGVFLPGIDPIFGPTAETYWSSTTAAHGAPVNAWHVGLFSGSILAAGKSAAIFVRAVRGGEKPSSATATPTATCDR
jgi:hypothetical protein